MVDGRRAYARSMQAARKAMKSVGLLGVLDRGVHHRPIHFIRSQFAIYDFHDLSTLDCPWWSYSAIDFVSEWLAGRPSTRAFEWGAGSSTLWFQSRVDHLVSVEHDIAFADGVRSHIDQNVSLMVVPATASTQPDVPSGHRDWAEQDFTDYVDAISTVDGDFDLISIDGRARTYCLSRAVDRLSADGIIVFDNSDRGRYQDALEGTPLKTECFRGWGPALPIKTSTSVLHAGGSHR